MMNTKNISIDSFQSNRRFYDDKNYPRGMSRSGDYTLNEVKILEQHGIALQAIADGSRAPVNEEEQRFKDVCEGKLTATSSIEKTWLKYQNKVLSPKQFHTLFGRTKVETNTDDIDVSDTVDINE